MDTVHCTYNETTGNVHTGDDTGNINRNQRDESRIVVTSDSGIAPNMHRFGNGDTQDATGTRGARFAW